jgi:hypothetical protein
MMKELERRKGVATVDETYSLFSHLVRWLIEQGHGTVTLSAIDSGFGAKFRTDTVVTVGRKR